MAALAVGLVSLIATADQHSALEFESVWIRALPPLQPNTAAYLTLITDNSQVIEIEYDQEDYDAIVDDFRNKHKQGGYWSPRTYTNVHSCRMNGMHMEEINLDRIIGISS